jgi:hypothetical protein
VDAQPSTLSLWRFSVLSTAVTMTAAFAHLMELSAKMRFEPSLWVRLHRTMYPNFGRTAGPAEPAAVISAGLLAWRTRQEQPEAFRSTAIAAACLAGAHAIFWRRTARQHRGRAMAARCHSPRLDKTARRHAIRAGLVTAALGALIMAPRQVARHT